MHAALQKPYALPACLLVLGASPIIAALISQYGFGYPPCELCLLQRYPYAAVCALALLALLAPRFTTLLAWLSVIGFVTTAGIAVFHVGVEQSWWEYASACSSLRDAIMGAPLVSCSQETFIFLGLSMAAWNALTGLGFAALVAYMITHRKDAA